MWDDPIGTRGCGSLHNTSARAQQTTTLHVHLYNTLSLHDAVHIHVILFLLFFYGERLIYERHILAASYKMLLEMEILVKCYISNNGSILSNDFSVFLLYWKMAPQHRLRLLTNVKLFKNTNRRYQISPL